VQPIYVDDVAEYILQVLEQERFRNETLELGGPAVLTMEELLQRIRRARRGGDESRGASLHIPLGFLMRSLQAAESAGFGRLLPLSAGQLASFRFDGTIETNGLYESRRASLKDVQEMLELSLAAAWC
jgi:hypothetical protein